MFPSFFWGSFEPESGVVPHRKQITGDYRLLRQNGIRVVCEAISWAETDRGNGRFDLSSLDPTLAAAQTLGVRVVYGLLCLGPPDRLDPRSPDFPLHFADHCRAMAEYLDTFVDGPHTFRFGSQSIMGADFARCAIAGTDAIRGVLPSARFILASQNPKTIALITGQHRPELGGSPGHLDILGLALGTKRQSRKAFADFLRSVGRRFHTELVVLDAGSTPRSIARMASQVEELLDEGLPIRGICLNPAIGEGGLWNASRIPDQSSLNALGRAQQRLEGLTFPAGGVPRVLTNGDGWLC